MSVNVRKIASRVAVPLHDMYEVQDFPLYQSGKEPIEKNPPGITPQYKKFFKSFHLDVDVIRVNAGGKESSRKDLEASLSKFTRPDRITLVELNHKNFSKGPEWLVHDAVGHMALDLPLRASGFDAAVRDAISEDYGIPDLESVQLLGRAMADNFFGVDEIHFFFGLISLPTWTGTGDRADIRTDRLADLAVRYVLDNGVLMNSVDLDNVPLCICPVGYGVSMVLPEDIAKDQKMQVSEVKTGTPGLPKCTDLFDRFLLMGYQAIADHFSAYKGKLLFNMPENWHGTK